MLPFCVATMVLKISYDDDTDDGTKDETEDGDDYADDDDDVIG